MRAYRVKIALTEPQRIWLEAEARRLGLPLAELVRRILDQHRPEPERETA